MPGRAGNIVVETIGDWARIDSFRTKYTNRRVEWVAGGNASVAECVSAEILRTEVAVLSFVVSSQACFFAYPF